MVTDALSADRFGSRRTEPSKEEQALRHRAERVDAVAPQRDFNILSLQEVPEPLHSAFLQKNKYALHVS